MSLLNSLRSIISGKAWQGWSDSTFRIGDYNRTSSIDPTSMRLLAIANGQVLRCAWLNATVAASCTPRLFRKKNARMKLAGERADRKSMAYLRGDTPHALPANVKDALRGEDAIEILDSEVLDLIRKPNPYQTGTLYRMSKYFHMQLAGDYWAHIVSDAPGELPYALAPMVPQYVTVEIGGDGLPSRILYGKDGSRAGGVGTPFDPDECVCWKFRPSRTSLYRGEGWLVNAYREAGLLEKALVAQDASWENMQRPDWVFMLPKEATQPQVDDARKSIEGRHRGVRNAGKPFVAVGTSIETLSWSPKDSMFDTQIQTMMKIVRNAAGVPEALQDMNSATFENAAASVTTHRRDTILPMLNIDAEQDNEFLLEKLGLEGDYFIVYPEVVPEDITRQAELARAMKDTNSTTANEIRKVLGLDPEPWGDEPPNQNPTTSTFGGMGGASQSPEDKPKEETPAPEVEPEDDPEEETKAIKLAAFTIPDRYAPVECHKHCRKAAPDPLSESGIQRFADSLELWYRRAAEQFGINPNGTVNLPPHAASELARLLDAPLAGVTDAAVQRASESHPDRMASLNVEQLQRYGDNYRVQLAREITSNLENELTEAIKRGTDEGLSMADTTQRIKEILPDEAGWRALRIANTETTRANQETDIEVWKQIGVKEKRWLLAPDACSVCQAFYSTYAKGGAPVPIDYVYAPMGTTITGADGKSITTWRNVVSGPLHPNDRCDQVASGSLDLGEIEI
jgi:phage portal protein BeeE